MTPLRSRPHEALARRTAAAMRPLYVVLGLVMVGLGIIGVFLPVMPTTIFLIVAAWAFARSSPRLHDWLYHHPRFGRTLRDWNRHGVIPPRAKFWAITAQAASLAVVAWSTRSPGLIVAVGLCLLWAMLFIISRPSHPTDPSTVESPPDRQD